MDTNMVIPTGPDTTTVVYDYFLQKDKIEELGEEMENYLRKPLYTAVARPSLEI